VSSGAPRRDPGPLVARTRRIDGDVDLLAAAGADGVLLERGRVGLAGRGVALRLPVGEAEVALAAIEVDDEVEAPGTGAVAFGALPFVPDPVPSWWSRRWSGAGPRTGPGG
jgi:menaquinone-specific isochorismate synthase